MPRRGPALLAAAALAVALAGCGKDHGERERAAGPTPKVAPVTAQGALSVSTRNTTRLGGADVATDAAAVARAVYPGLTAATRPQTVVLVDRHDWPAALAASVLAGAPANAPILYSEGEKLPEVTQQTLTALHPLGAAALGGAQVIEVGTTAPVPDGYLVDRVPAGQGAVVAAAIARVARTLDRAAPRAAIVIGAQAPAAVAMPAAALAAQSGAPILPTSGASLSAPTAEALRALRHPSIYVIDAAALGAGTMRALAHLGSVGVVTAGTAAGFSAVSNAIDVARYTNGTFGWGVKEPGHGLVFANAGRPFDAPAAALLSATGDYAPLLLLESATRIPSELARYLSDIQPAYTAQVPPVRGIYNHGWLIGDESAISAVVQAELDSMLEIVASSSSEEQSATEPE